MKSKLIGDLLLDAGRISLHDAENIVRIQKFEKIQFGEAAKTLGLVTDDDIQKALSQQFNHPFDTIDNLNPELIAAQHPNSPKVETLRNIRSQLMLRWFDSSRKSLVIISCERNEGRSFFAANLAITIAQLGKKTILVDADLRNPRQHKLFNINNQIGLSDILATRTSSLVVYKHQLLKGLSILPSGPSPPNPQELIGRSFASCLQKLNRVFDVIIIDSTASKGGADAQILATITGGALLLCKLNHTGFNDFVNTKNLLQASHVVCVGTVINNF